MVLAAQSGSSKSEDLCPICGGKEFEEFRGRSRSNCVKCGSKERHRLMAMVLGSDEVPKKSHLPVYHFAPERSISGVLQEIFGDTYRPVDFMPERYAWSKIPVQKIDLTRPLKYFELESVGGFVHSHVLEHVPTSVDRVVRDMNAALAPGGFHIFQVPVHKGWYREDMNPDLDPAERTRLFHQADHMRRFGDEDFEERVLDLFSDMISVDVSSTVDKGALQCAGIAPTAITKHTGHSVFLFRKPGNLIDKSRVL